LKIHSAHIYALRIPFKNPFTHNLKNREYCDSVIVKLVADNGVSGFGECVPRPYVTGESVSSCMHRIRNTLLPILAKYDFPENQIKKEPWTLLSEISDMLPDEGGSAVIAWNASKAAVEIALVDCLLRYVGKSAVAILPPARETVIYSAVITAGPIAAVKKIAIQCKQYAVEHIKIKVGIGDDYARVAAVREIVGDSVSLRIDANGAYDVKDALSLIRLVQPLHIDCVEQPVPRGDIKMLAHVKADSPVRIMADESVITSGDAEALIENNACDLFNLRISKNGGFFKVLQIADMARQAGIGLQLGCQVGETAILSAAGRHLAAHMPDLRFIEGSYGTLLLKEDITRESIQFGHGGKAPLITGDGLGIRVNEDVLGKYAKNTISVPLE